MSHIIIASIVLTLAAITAAAWFLVRKTKKYIAGSLTEISDSQKIIKKSQSACQAALVSINLPKLIERVNEHEIAIRGIGQIEHIAQRIESNAELYKEVIIKFTERVEQIDNKLLEMSQAFSDHRQEQTDQLKCIFDRLKKHDKIINDIQEKIMKMEREAK